MVSKKILNCRACQALRLGAQKYDSPSQSAAELGATIVEYVLLVSLLAAVCITAIAFLGVQASEMFSTTASGFQGNG